MGYLDDNLFYIYLYIFISDGLRENQVHGPAKLLWAARLRRVQCGPLLPRPTSSLILFVLAGMGDMAVSNSIGSNVFDILIGLGLPWALQTLAVDYGSYVSVLLYNVSLNSGYTDWVSSGLGQGAVVPGKGDVEILMLWGKQILLVHILQSYTCRDMQDSRAEVSKLSVSNKT